MHRSGLRPARLVGVATRTRTSKSGLGDSDAAEASQRAHSLIAVCEACGGGFAGGCDSGACVCGEAVTPACVSVGRLWLGRVCLWGGCDSGVCDDSDNDSDHGLDDAMPNLPACVFLTRPCWMR